MSERPIFVVGFQRSGTTLLQSLLGAHPRIAAPPEVHFFFRILDLQDYWGDLHDDARVTPVVHELVHAPMGMLDECGFDESRLVQRFLTTDRSYRALLETLLSDFAERQGKPRWSEKTPHQRPRQIWRLMPDAQIVHIVRDPRETVASAVTAWRHRQGPLQLAERWREFVLASIADGAEGGPAAYRQIRYEDLAARPEPVLREICDFLGEEFSPAMVSGSQRATAVPSRGTAWQGEAAGPVRSPEPVWTRRLGRVDRALVSAVVDDVLPQLGYPPAAVGARIGGRLLLPLAQTGARVADRRRRRPSPPARTPEERYAAVRAMIEQREKAAAEHR